MTDNLLESLEQNNEDDPFALAVPPKKVNTTKSELSNAVNKTLTGNRTAPQNPSGSGAEKTEKNDALNKEEVALKRGEVVVAGKKVEIKPPPPLPSWLPKENQDTKDGLDDIDPLSYTDLEVLNKDLLNARIRMNRIRRDMRDAGRAAVEAKIRYSRAYRRALIQQSGGTAEMRKASAELSCEELEADMLMKQQVADEYSSLFRSARDDVDNIKTVAYNLRSLYQTI